MLKRSSLTKSSDHSLINPHPCIGVAKGVQGAIPPQNL